MKIPSQHKSNTKPGIQLRLEPQADTHCPKKSRSSLTGLAMIGLISLGGITAAFATPMDQARRMHDRLAGIPPSPEVLCAMADLITNGTAVAAADIVMDTGAVTDPTGTTCSGDGTIDNSASKKAFYSTSLKNFVTPWTNEERTIHAPLNDYTSTIIGIIRDDLDFRLALTGDFIYKAAGSTWSGSSNAAYETLESSHADLSDGGVFVQQPQAGLISGTTATDRGGITTTRAAGKAFFSGGTNRLMLTSTIETFLCRGIAGLKEITRVPDLIRQDVSRSPGGDSSIYLNECIGCHAGMDPLAGAYAYYEWQADSNPDDDVDSGSVTYSSTMVHNLAATPVPIKHKYLINASNFPAGYITTSNSWKNYWRAGPNSNIGWPGNGPGDPNEGKIVGGTGVNSMQAELANTEAFAKCQVEKVYAHVCLQPPTSEHQADIERIVGEFKNGNYQMKPVFAETAALCSGS